MKEAIAVKALESFIPHRPPMVWVNNVLWANETEGEGEVVVDPQAHYCHGNTIRPSSFIEWVAQSYGFCRAAYNHQKGINAVLKKAYLAAFQDFTFPSRAIAATPKTRLIIHTKVIRQLGPISLVEGV